MNRDKTLRARESKARKNYALLSKARVHLAQSLELGLKRSNSEFERLCSQVAARGRAQWTDGRARGEGAIMGAPLQSCRDSVAFAGWDLLLEEDDGSVVAVAKGQAYFVQEDGGPVAVAVDVVDLVKELSPVMDEMLALAEAVRTHKKDQREFDTVSNGVVYLLCQRKLNKDGVKAMAREWYPSVSEELFIQGFLDGLARYQAGERFGGNGCQQTRGGAVVRRKLKMVSKGQFSGVRS